MILSMWSILTGGSSLQWFWFTGGLSPKLPVSSPCASQEKHDEDAGERSHSVALRCQAGETLWESVFALPV